MVDFLKLLELNLNYYWYVLIFVIHTLNEQQKRFLRIFKVVKHIVLEAMLYAYTIFQGQVQSSELKRYKSLADTKNVTT